MFLLESLARRFLHNSTASAPPKLHGISSVRWQLVVSVCLERLPLTCPPLTQLEADYRDLVQHLELESSLLSGHEVRKAEEQSAYSLILHVLFDFCWILCYPFPGRLKRSVRRDWSKTTTRRKCKLHKIWKISPKRNLLGSSWHPLKQVKYSMACQCLLVLKMKKWTNLFIQMQTERTTRSRWSVVWTGSWFLSSIGNIRTVQRGNFQRRFTEKAKRYEGAVSGFSQKCSNQLRRRGSSETHRAASINTSIRRDCDSPRKLTARK